MVRRMQDVFAYCAELVRTNDRDRFIATLFAPAELRPALYALYAFNAEVARTRDVAREPLPGEIRLQWWSDVLGGERDAEARANPVVSALLTVIERHRLARSRLIDLVEARRFDLYNEPMGSVADLETYARKTSSAVFDLAVQILMGQTEQVAEDAGIAYAIAGLLRALPLHVERRQLYIPADILERHEVRTHELFAKRSSAGLAAALAEMRELARRHLAAVHARMIAVPRQAIPALLPVALVRPALDHLQRSDPFAPSEIPPWRRQWIIWRASRNPARIAG